MDKYQLTRTIRFKLESDENFKNNLIDEKIDNVKDITQLETSDDNLRLQDYIQNLNKQLSELVQNIQILPEKIRKVIYKEPNYEGFRDKCPEIKYGFLKIYTKADYEQFYTQGDNKTYKINQLIIANNQEKQVNFLDKAFKQWFADWHDVSSKLAESTYKLKHERHNFDKRPEIGLLIRRLNSRMLFPFIRDFILMTDSKTDHLTNEIEEISRLLDKCEKQLKPTQADGLIIARASFNYYTIHKESKYNDETLSSTKKFDSEIHNLSGEKWKEENLEKSELYRVIFTHFFDININDLLQRTKDTNNLFSEINKNLKYNPHHDSKIYPKLVKVINKKLNIIAKNIHQKETEYTLAESNDKKSKLKKRLTVLKNIESSLNNDINILENPFCSPDDIAVLENKKLQENLVLLNYFYLSMKDYKATAKQEFYQAVQQGEISFKDLSKYPLFSKITGTKDEQTEFNNFLKLSREIEELSTELNQGKLSRQSIKDKSDTKKIKCEQRGRYLTTLKGNKIYFENYVKFCDLFKNIALARGRIKARVNALKQEKTDAQRIQFWSVIAEKNGNLYLILFPKMLDPNMDEGKTYAQKAYETLSNMQDAKKGEIKLHIFESLTHRALEKLCFSGVSEKTNTFWSKVKNEIQGDIQDLTEDSRRHDPFNFINEASKIKFYQLVLKSNYAQKVLKGVDFQRLQATVLDKDFNNDFYAFREALESYSYIKHVHISGKGFNKINKQFQAQILKIQSSDLTRDNRCQSSYKEHTRLWQQFWTDENAKNLYQTRLNPEISISWREPKASRLKKYSEGKSKYDKEKYKKNRYLHPQLTLRTTITTNAAKKNIDTEFLDRKTIEEKFKHFNKMLLQHDTDQPIEYVIGIDVGKVDLAAITLFKAKGKIPDNILSDLSNDKFLRIDQLEQMQGETQLFPVWSINKNPETEQYDFHKTYHFKKKDKTKARYIIDNPSYFVARHAYDYSFPDGDYEKDFSRFFTKKEVSGLDLTIAKVIDGKIITNAALRTYQKLKERDARRLICIIKELHPEAILDVAEKEKGGIALFYRSNECKKPECICQSPIYHYNRKYDTPNFSKDYTSKSIDRLVLEQAKEKLQAYLDNKSNPSLLIEESKINHLRQAIAANMVGVLYHLYERYPCLIALEHIDHSTIESHRQQFSGDISRYLEWAIYRKFQKTYRVPPNIKDIVNLRGAENQMGLRQFGMVFWVDKETSKYCPRCGKKSNKDYETNKKKGFFICEHCGFDTRHNIAGFEGINDPDKVAAYNIAKLGFASYASELAMLQKKDN